MKVCQKKGLTKELDKPTNRKLLSKTCTLILYR